MKYLLILLFVSLSAQAAAPNTAEVSMAEQLSLRSSLSASPTKVSSFSNSVQAINWIAYQSRQLQSTIPDNARRYELLRMVHYEATRNGLDPDIVLALIRVESNFDRYAISKVGASGLMQVMPFWRELIGSPNDSLFDPMTNLRYGCLILKHYLTIERGNLPRALARYNGSLGQSKYPDLVLVHYSSRFRSQ